MKNLILVAFICMIGCKTTKLDHSTGERNPTTNTRHMNKIHKTPWYAGNDLITPVNFKPVKATVKK